MKFAVGIAFLALVHCASAAASLKSVGVSFGPKNCVRLTRSHAGSCVLTTNCEGIDTSQTEFAFDCIGQNGKGDVVRHSFGVGGFEASEEFDSEVRCGRCATVSHDNEFPIKAPVRKVEAILKPATQPIKKVAAAVAHAVPTAKPESKHEEVVPGAVSLKSKTQASAWPFSGGEKKKGGSNAVKYGPNGCVSTWRSSEGHCIMRTKCNKADIANYEFGLVCVDKNGSPVKHMFGKDSFDPKETFDTLIKCDQCLGLEDIPDTVALAGEVASMAKDVKNIEEVMKNISINVNMLNKAVFPAKEAGPAPGPASAAPAPAAAAKPAKFLVHEAVSHHRHHHRGNLRHSQKRHHRHHRREEDDDDDDDDEEYQSHEYDHHEQQYDDDDREDDREEEQEPPRNAVDDVNAAAVKLQQQQAEQAAAAAQFRSVPMNAASSNTAQVPLSRARDAEDDDTDDDDSGYD